VSAGNLTATDDIFVDAAGSVLLASADAVDQLVIGTTTLPSDLTITGLAEGAGVDIQATGPIVLNVVNSTAGDVDVLSTMDSITTDATTSVGGDVILSAATTVNAPVITSSNAIIAQSSGGGTVDLGSIDAGSTIDLDTSGAVIVNNATSIGQTNVGTTIVVTSADFADNINAGSVEIISSGVLNAQDINAQNGSVIIDGNTVSADNLTATDDIIIDTVGALSLASADAVDQFIVGATTMPSSLTITGASEGAGVNLQVTGDVLLNTVTSTAGDVVVASSGGSITAEGVSSNGGDAVLMAANNVTSPSIMSSVGIDVDSMNGGILDLGTLNAGTTIDLDTSGAVTAGPSTSGSALSIGGAGATASVALSGEHNVGSINVVTAGVFNNAATIEAGPDASISSGEVELVDGSSLSADVVVFSASASGEVVIGDGTGLYVLDATELSRIRGVDVIIDAGTNDMSVGGVEFTSGLGTNSLSLATTGDIRLQGDVSVSGADRNFRFGGAYDPANGTVDGFANLITANIDQASFDFGSSTIELSGVDIVFGRDVFIDEVAGLSDVEIAQTFIGNSNSSLYNSVLSGSPSDLRTIDPIYLRAGNLIISHENSALFQNTGFVSNELAQTSGVLIGEIGGNGTLTINTVDDTNAFALFGQINELTGDTAALAGPNVVSFDENLRLAASRINGCQIGSGADCVTTQIGTTTIEVPRENVILLEADRDIQVPFDPLVGTNNEGLFSDAASSTSSFDCQRDAAGDCISPLGEE